MTRRDRTIIALLAGAAVVGLAASQFMQPDGPDDGIGSIDAEDAELVALGKSVYAANCSSCHGDRLQGQANWKQPLPEGGFPAPPHDETGHTWHHPDDLLFQITKFGGESVAGKDSKSHMPGFQESLSDREIWAALSYIKSRWPREVRLRHDQVNATARR